MTKESFQLATDTKVFTQVKLGSASIHCILDKVSKISDVI